eukprot:TRINITY_DN3867_c0_g1_i1.p1 TRINITY_DN3867_c0_g1~~TRINITY_DN3867_c0_g1_i1.p1  ORF type:complete len:876 (-),score=242.28 TRINITY_DN3867_c0_g1_i1:171-2759(-)
MSTPTPTLTKEQESRKEVLFQQYYQYYFTNYKQFYLNSGQSEEAATSSAHVNAIGTADTAALQAVLQGTDVNQQVADYYKQYAQYYQQYQAAAAATPAAIPAATPAAQQPAAQPAAQPGARTSVLVSANSRTLSDSGVGNTADYYQQYMAEYQKYYYGYSYDWWTDPRASAYYGAPTNASASAGEVDSKLAELSVGEKSQRSLLPFPSTLAQSLIKNSSTREVKKRGKGPAPKTSDSFQMLTSIYNHSRDTSTAAETFARAFLDSFVALRRGAEDITRVNMRKTSQSSLRDIVEEFEWYMFENFRKHETLLCGEDQRKFVRTSLKKCVQEVSALFALSNTFFPSPEATVKFDVKVSEVKEKSVTDTVQEIQQHIYYALRQIESTAEEIRVLHLQDPSFVDQRKKEIEKEKKEAEEAKKKAEEEQRRRDEEDRRKEAEDQKQEEEEKKRREELKLKTEEKRRLFQSTKKDSKLQMGSRPSKPTEADLKKIEAEVPLDQVQKLQRWIKSKLIRRKWMRACRKYKTHKDSSKTRQRAQVLKEILSTEKNYVNALDILINHFLQPLRTLAKKSPDVCSIEEVNTVFSSVEMIYTFHSKVFLPEMEKALKKWPSSGNFCQLFLTHIPAMRMYTTYVNSYDEAAATYLRLLAKKPFTEAVSIFKQNAKTRLEMDSFLIQPVQRLPRYELLLRELGKVTEEGHADHAPCQKSLAGIKEVNLYINKMKKEKESRDMLLKIQSTIGELPHPLVAPHRTFVLKIETDAESNKSIRSMRKAKNLVVCFNDILVRAQERFFSSGYDFAEKIELSWKLDVSISPSNSQAMKLTCKTDGHDIDLTIYFPDAATANNWTKTISEISRMLHTKKDSHK